MRLLNCLKALRLIVSIKSAKLVTTEFNLFEFAYAVTRDYTDTAEEICSQVRHSMRLYHPGDRESLRAAEIRRRYSHERRKYSLVDCVGYSVAESLAIPVLAGDQEFYDLPGVEYVK